VIAGSDVRLSEPPSTGAAPEISAVEGRRRWLARYVRRRLLILVPLAFVVTLASFGMTHLAPGGPVAALLQDNPSSPATIKAIEERYKLNDSLVVQYRTWITGVVHGNLGRSIITNDAVTNEITRRMSVTLFLNATGIMLAILLGIPLGVLAALRRGRLLDRVLVTLSVLFMSTPAFALGLFMLYFLGFEAGLFPLYGPGTWVVSRAHHLALPALVLGLHGMGFVMRLTRAAMLEQFEQDYIAFARARGLGAVHVTVRYALRNALIPVTTAAGLLLTGLLTGSVLVETVFALPGLGTLLVNSVIAGDFPMIQGLLLFIAAWIILINIVVDVTYAFIDPRVGFGKAAS
jgi:peptide/nickel transport system permease protein